MASSSTILVVGGTGGVGKRVSLASARLGHPTVVLVRDLAPSDPAKKALLDSFQKAGITLVKGDITDTASLVAALNGVDVVILVVARTQILDQLNLLDAIKQVGTVKRFLPSEFGNHADRHLKLLDDIFLNDKATVRDAIEKAGVPYTYVISGAGTTWYLYNLWQTGLDAPPRDKVTIFGDGNAKALIIDDDDIGTYTVLAADDPRTENKIFYVKPDGIYKSQNELVAMWEQKIGHTLEKAYIPKEELEREANESPHPANLLAALRFSTIIQGYKSDVSDGVEASELYPDVKYTSHSEYLDRLV